MTTEDMELLARLQETDIAAMRRAGGQLAEAAVYVITNYDGCHRLSLAVAEWMKVIADEGGRGDRHGK